MGISEGTGSPTASLSATPEPQAASHQGLLGRIFPTFSQVHPSLLSLSPASLRNGLRW